jgi:hypothetical protein
MERYQLGKIYKITSEHTDKIYVGSTCKKLLCQRLAAHSSNFNQWKKGNYNYISSFELFELGSVQITLLEAYPCNTRDELLAKERYWIEQYKDNIVNKNIPIISVDERLEKMKKYNEEHKELISEQMKQYYKETKEQRLEHVKKYYEENKQTILKQNKKYREENKEKIAEKQRRQIIICECGSNLQLHSKARHERSKKHLNFLNTIN